MQTTSNINPPTYSRKVFVVHGHDVGARETVARFLSRLEFEPIILHEQANQGRTIIEKFTAHGDVGFAVVLLTPDDEGCEAGGKPRPRARQNVILELGYFVGLLGRERVLALRRGDVEIPSDFTGVLYEDLDARGAWRTRIGQELQAAGYMIDWNKAMQPRLCSIAMLRMFATDRRRGKQASSRFLKSLRRVLRSRGS